MEEALAPLEENAATAAAAAPKKKKREADGAEGKKPTKATPPPPPPSFGSCGIDGCAETKEGSDHNRRWIPIRCETAVLSVVRPGAVIGRNGNRRDNNKEERSNDDDRRGTAQPAQTSG